MAKRDHLRSTAKLLTLIRRRRDKNTTADTDGARSGAPFWRTPAVFRLLALPKQNTIGVDIGHTYIKFAKIQHLADKTFRLVDYRDAPISKSISLKDPDIRKVLKDNLDRLCAGPGRFTVWSAIASGNVDIRCIRIPKVPAGRIPNAVFWMFTRKVSFDPDTELLDFEVLADVVEDGVKKIEIMAFKAPRREIEDLRTTFERIGYPLKGISIVPFSIQNLFRTGIVPAKDQEVCCLFVGRDWSRIAIFNNGNLVLSRGIKAGMHGMVEAINIGLFKPDELDPTPENTNDTAPAAITKSHPMAQKAFFDFLRMDGSSRLRLSENSEISLQRIFQLLEPALERLIRQIERTFEHYALNFHCAGIRRVLISGQITASRLMIDHIGNQLDMPIAIMDPFTAVGAFTEKVDIPKTATERESYVPAIGIALSSNRKTPNFLFPHEKKDRIESIRKNNMRLLSFCMICLLLLIGAFAWQERRLDAKRVSLDKLNQQFFNYSPPAEKNLLLALFAKTRDKHSFLKQVARRYAPVAVVHEIAKRTPANIRLIKIEAAFGHDTEGAPGSVTIEGLIFSDAQGSETALTTYLFNLKNSPMFSKPHVGFKRVEFFDNQQVLRFGTKLDMIEPRPR